MSEACCICAQLLRSANSPPPYDEKTEKPSKSLGTAQNFECCRRAVCSSCLRKTPRYRSYCPYCQVTTTLLDDANDSDDTLVDNAAGSRPRIHSVRPDYSMRREPAELSEKAELELDAPDVLHFVDHATDSIHTLSIRYGVPASCLRQANNIYSDHLIAGRRTIIVPGKFYKGGVSLSPRPIEGEEEELRKGKIRKFQTVCKVPEYELATLYLEQATYDLDLAVQVYQEEEAWEQRNPLAKGKHPKKLFRTI